MDLGKKYVSTSDLKRWGWVESFNNVFVSDDVAIALATSIQKNGIDVPSTLGLSTRHSDCQEERTDYSQNAIPGWLNIT